MDINCPDCGHDIDSHIARRCSTPEGSRCPCEAFPSEIASAVLAALMAMPDLSPLSEGDKFSEGYNLGLHEARMTVRGCREGAL